MITGFNTDIEHEGVVYHVQTEDKGLESPLILSLVYSGGAILASKRSPYEDLIASGFDEAALAQRLKRQHRLICAAIHAGRIDDLKKMGGRADDKAMDAPETTEPEIIMEGAPAEGFEAEAPFESEIVFDSTVEIIRERVEPEETESEQTAAEETTPPPVSDNIQDLLISNTEYFQMVSESAAPPASENIQDLLVNNADDYQTLAENAPPPEPPPSSDPDPVSAAAPPANVAPPPQPGQSSPYTIYDSRRQSPLGPVSKTEGMSVTILDEPEFRAGQVFNIRVLVDNRSGDTGRPLANAALSVKILGTTFRPQLYTVKTGKDGVAVVSVHIPSFKSGRAAVLVRADAEGKFVEIRRVIHSAL